MNDIGIKRITPSMLVEYEKCPKLFYYRSWLGIKMPDSKVHLFFGTAVHAAIDHIYFLRPTWEEKDPQFFQQVVEIFKKEFKLEHVDIPDMSDSDRQVRYDEMILDGCGMLEQFWAEKEYLWAEGVQPVRMELPIKMDVWNPKTKENLCVPMSGRLDGETEGNDVIEFKTSSAKYDNFETHGSCQARSYVWMQYCRTGKIPVVHYVILLKKRKRERIQYLPLRFDEGDIMSFDSKVRTMLEKIRNREFDKPMRNHDRWCDCEKYERLLRPPSNNFN